MKQIIHSAVFCLLTCVVVSCDSSDPRMEYTEPIDPEAQPAEFSKALIIDGELREADFPEATAGNALRFRFVSPSASVTNDNTLFIPFVYQSDVPIKGAFIEIEGANNYWDIPLEGIVEESHVLGLGIPANVLNGRFDVNYSLYDENGDISQPAVLPTEIVSTENRCANGQGFERVRGNDGMTVRTYDLGDVAGEITVSFWMFTVKDRMDVRYGNQWVGSTDNQLLSMNAFPPTRECRLATQSEGFVSGGGAFTINYDPAVSRKLDVYVSGCLDGGTEWYFDVSCPAGSDQSSDDDPADPVICGQPSAQDTYDPTESGYHFYPKEGETHLTRVLCDPMTNARCTEQLAYQTMLEQANYIAPTDDEKPVVDCKVTFVWFPLLGLDPIVTKVNAARRQITNYTLEDYDAGRLVKQSHVLHPGKVTRKISTNDDGKVIITTEGEGTGIFPSLNTAQWATYLAWTFADDRLEEAVQGKLGNVQEN